MSNYQCEICGKMNIDTPGGGYIEGCNCHQRIRMMRQWLNEDRITDPKKMVTSEDLIYWFKENLCSEDVRYGTCISRVFGYNQKSSEIANQIKKIKL